MGRLRSKWTPRLLIATILLVVAVGPALAQERRPIQPVDLLKVRRVVSAEMSPDGRYTAYLVTRPRNPFEEKDGTDRVELYLWNEARHCSVPFVTGQDTAISNVRWTPDGRHISFLAKRQGDRRRSLYVIAVDGGESRKVFEHETDITAYEWSTEGDRLAFLAAEPTPEERERRAKQGFNQEIFEEDRPYTRLWVANVDGFTITNPRQLPLEGSVSVVQWSPSGLLAVVVAPTPLVDDYYMRRRIRIVHPDTGQTLTKIENPGKLGPLSWSPDGTRLAFVSALHIHDPAAGRLMVADAETGAFHEILPDFPGHVTNVTWQDNETLLFLADEGVWTTLNRIRATGGERHILLGPAGPILTSMSFSRTARRAALVAHTPQHPPELYSWSEGAARPARLTNHNEWLAGVRLATQEPIRYRARDGLEIEAILIRPLDWQPNRRYPLVVTVHGGPESHVPQGWVTRYATPGQLLAARGYAVVYPNYRGSTGRGVEFSMLDHGDPAGKEFDDLVDCVDHLVETGLVDPDKVAVTGGSYGGYATAWCSTYYSERFAAGVMFVGISDKISKAGTTDIPDEIYLVHDRHRLWEAWELFLERSPIYYVQKARTPLLILHGKEDTRVHPSQSLELYRHLKTLGQTPVRLVFYPGEGHGNRRAASRLDYVLRALRWMDWFVVEKRKELPPPELDYEALLGYEGQ